MRILRFAGAALAGILAGPVTLAASAPTASAAAAPPIRIRANAPVGVAAGDYLLTVSGLSAPSTTVGQIAQQLAGAGPLLRAADVKAGPTPVTTTADLRISGPSDVVSVTIPSASWSSMTLSPASWGYLVRGPVITAPGGGGVKWHGVAGSEAMTSSDFDQLQAWAPGVKVMRLIVDERCWDSFFTARPRICPSASDYQARVKGAVANAISHGIVAIVTPTDAGRDQPDWVPNGQGDLFGPDQRTIVLWHQLVQLWGANPQVVFEAMNEPKMIVNQTYNGILGATLWATGGTVTLSNITWTAPGLQQIVDTIRADGATNMILVQGAAWGGNLTPVEKTPILGTNIAYSFHGYSTVDNKTNYPPSMDWAIAPIIDPNGKYRYAGMLTEFGTKMADDVSGPNGSQYLSSVIDWANAHGVGWSAYAWFPTSWDAYGLLQSYRPLRMTSRGQTIVNKL